MGIHINLKEEKIIRVHANVERKANIEFHPQKIEIRQRLFRDPIVNIIKSEGWYGEHLWNTISKNSMEKLIEKGEYKMIDDVPYICAHLCIVTSSNNQYYEYFESDEAMDERLYEIREETKCDFFCVGND